MLAEIFLSTLTEKDFAELFKKGKLNVPGFSLYVKNGVWRNDGDNRSGVNANGLCVSCMACQANKRPRRQAVRAGAENKQKDALTWPRTNRV